jgi:hypothetical protein
VPVAFLGSVSGIFLGEGSRHMTVVWLGVAFLSVTPVVLATLIFTIVAITLRWPPPKIAAAMAGHVVTVWLIAEIFLPPKGDVARSVYLWSYAGVTVIIIALFIFTFFVSEIRRINT